LGPYILHLPNRILHLPFFEKPQPTPTPTPCMFFFFLLFHSFFSSSCSTPTFECQRFQLGQRFQLKCSSNDNRGSNTLFLQLSMSGTLQHTAPPFFFVFQKTVSETPTLKVTLFWKACSKIFFFRISLSRRQKYF